MSTSDANIPSNYSRLIARELGLSSRQLPELLAGTGLTVGAFLDEGCRLTAADQVTILENALRISDEPGFGLRTGKRLTPLSHGAMGFMAYSSPNLSVAMQAIQTFVPTRLSFARIDIRESKDQLVCEVRFEYPISDGVYRCLCETLAGMFCSISEIIVGRPLEEVVFTFPYAAPDYQSHYTEYLTGRAHFGARQMAVSIPLSVARIANTAANHENYLIAKQQCEAMLADVQDQAAGFGNRLRQLILSHPPGTLDETEAAAQMFMSKRTLARRLGGEGTSFRQVRDAVLSEQAADHLLRSDMSVEAIATLLNYHDSSNFRRAFKRWFRTTPDSYRRRYRDGVIRS